VQTTIYSYLAPFLPQYLYFLIFYLTSDSIQDAFKELYRNFRDIVSSLIQDGIDRAEFCKDVDPEAVAAALVGAWDALFLQAWFDRDFDPLDTAQKFLRVVVRGLKC
jgi:hypothetical protein